MYVCDETQMTPQRTKRSLVWTLSCAFLPTAPSARDNASILFDDGQKGGEEPDSAAAQEPGRRQKRSHSACAAFQGAGDGSQRLDSEAVGCGLSSGWLPRRSDKLVYDQAVVAAESDHDGVARINWSLGVQEAEGWQAAAYAVIRICLEESTELADTVAPGLAASLGGPPSDVFTNALITDAETQPQRHLSFPQPIQA
jgi:hypothetical protein